MIQDADKYSQCLCHCPLFARKRYIGNALLVDQPPKHSSCRMHVELPKHGEHRFADFDISKRWQMMLASKAARFLWAMLGELWHSKSQVCATQSVRAGHRKQDNAIRVQLCVREFGSASILDLLIGFLDT